MRIAAPATLALAFAAAAHASVGDVTRRAHWGQTARELAETFGPRATLLDRPIEYGDAEVRVVLRDEEIGGHDFTVYFQEDKAGGGLRRIHFERPRHGAVLGVFRDVVAALAAEYGAPVQSCDIPARGATVHQAQWTRIWERDGDMIRAVFRDTTVEATEGCLREERSGTSACGLTAQMFVQVSPRDARADGC